MREPSRHQAAVHLLREPVRLLDADALDDVVHLEAETLDLTVPVGEGVARCKRATAAPSCTSDANTGMHRFNFKMEKLTNKIDEISEIDEIVEIYEIDKIDEIDKINEIYKIDEIDEIN